MTGKVQKFHKSRWPGNSGDDLMMKMIRCSASFLTSLSNIETLKGNNERLGAIKCSTAISWTPTGIQIRDLMVQCQKCWPLGQWWQFRTDFVIKRFLTLHLLSIKYWQRIKTDWSRCMLIHNYTILLLTIQGCLFSESVDDFLISLRKCIFVLRFYGPCRARSVYLTTCLLGRLSPLSG